MLIAPPADTDVAFGGGVLHGVEHQVGKRAAQFGFTALELDGWVSFQGDLLIALRGQRHRVALDRLQQAVDGNWLVV
ncbi:hypothetical protein D3C76_1694270 [compost metagenome]